MQDRAGRRHRRPVHVVGLPEPSGFASRPTLTWKGLIRPSPRVPRPADTASSDFGQQTAPGAPPPLVCQDQPVHGQKKSMLSEPASVVAQRATPQGVGQPRHHPVTRGERPTDDSNTSGALRQVPRLEERISHGQ